MNVCRSAIMALVFGWVAGSASAVSATSGGIGCPAEPLSSCIQTSDDGSLLDLRRRVWFVGQTLLWTWGGDGTSRNDFGNPLSDTSYALCLYGQNAGANHLLLEAKVPAGGRCSGKPCWLKNDTGFTYLDPRADAAGIAAITLRSTKSGEGTIAVLGFGDELDLPNLPLPQDPMVVVQLRNTFDGGRCWEARYSAPPKRNTDEQFSDAGDPPQPPGTPTSTATTSGTPTATATPPPASTPTATGTRTNTATASPTGTPTFTPPSTATASATATATPTTTGTAASTSTSTATHTNTATASPSSTPTSTAASTPTATATRTNTATASPSSTPTSTPASTATATATGTNTATASPSSTPTSTAASTPTATATRTNTATASPSSTPTATAASTATATATRTNTATASATPPSGNTPTATPTPTTGSGSCGNGFLEPGETCANCPADCVVQPCASVTPTVSFAVDLIPPAGQQPTAATVLMGYNSGLVSIPGTANDLSVRQRVLPPAPLPQSFSVNDLDYALRVVITRNTTLGFLFTARFDRCQSAPAPTVADFGCTVEGCAGGAGPIEGCTCIVRVP